MQISLTQFLARELQFNVTEVPEDGDNEFDIDFTASFYTERKREFYLVFKTAVKNPKEFELSVTHLFVFTTDEDITGQFIDSHFPVVNAPAIAFPYIRAFISQTTLNCGYKPSILPSINFTKLQKGLLLLDGHPYSKGELPAQKQIENK